MLAPETFESKHTDTPSYVGRNEHNYQKNKNKPRYQQTVFQIETGRKIYNIPDQQMLARCLKTCIVDTYERMDGWMDGCTESPLAGWQDRENQVKTFHTLLEMTLLKMTTTALSTIMENQIKIGKKHDYH